MATKNILITGGSGFIGQHLVNHLLKQKYNLYLLLRPESCIPLAIEDSVTRLNCDYWSKEGISNTVQSHHFEMVLHLASYGVNPAHRVLQSISEINILLPAMLVELASEWGANMVMLGSCSEYARVEQDEKIDESYPLETGKLYGSSKAAGTLYACAVAEQLEVQLTVLRLFNVYGSGEAPHRLLPMLIKHLKNNERVPLSKGTQVRDFVYIKDVIDAITYAAEHPATAAGKYTNIWNICNGQGYSIRQFAEKVAQCLDKPVSHLGFGDLDMRPDDVPWVVGNPEKIYEESGWQPQYSLRDGILDVLSELNNDNNT